MYRLLLLMISLFFMSCMGGELKLLDIDRSKTIEINSTTGKELNDLKIALDSGAINQNEYERLKKKILKRLDETVDE